MACSNLIPVIGRFVALVCLITSFPVDAAQMGTTHAQPPSKPSHSRYYAQYAVQPSKIPNVMLEVRYVIRKRDGALIRKRVVGSYIVDTIPEP